MPILDYFPKINLSSDQREALLKLSSFLEGDDRIFILKGYAGTGKTFLSKGLVKYVKGQNRTLRLMAYTGRAATILQTKSGHQASTIHRAIYALKDIEQKKEIFVHRFVLKNNDDPKNTVYIVDEASMVPDMAEFESLFSFGSGRLLADLYDFIFHDRDDHPKLIFIGDEAQLQPIKHQFSPAMNPQHLSNFFQTKPHIAVLKKVHRQADGSGILENATELRNRLLNSTTLDWRPDTKNHDVHLLTYRNNMYQEYVDTAKKYGIKNVVIITDANARAQKQNQLIRRIIHGGMYHIMAGDRVVVIRNAYNYKVPIMNGQMATVKSVGTVENRSVKIKTKEKGMIDYHLSFRMITLDLDDGNEVTAYIHEDILNDDDGKVDENMARALTLDFILRMNRKKINAGTKEFNEMLQIDPYYNALFIRYGYSMTCYKAQGGEWDRVFVDLQLNFYNRQSASRYYRWIYTATTRAAQHLTYINGYYPRGIQARW